MKVLIVYYSQTGNTKKIAEAIYEITSQSHDTQLKNLKEVKVDDLNNYDLVFLGSACHSADLAPPVLKFLEKTPTSPDFKLAGFFTHSVTPPEGSEINKVFYEKWAGKCIKAFEKTKTEKEVDFKGYFRCRGAPSPAIEEFIHKSIITDENEFQEYVEEAKKHPDKTDIEDAKKFAQEILKISL